MLLLWRTDCAEEMCESAGRDEGDGAHQHYRFIANLSISPECTARHGALLMIFWRHGVEVTLSAFNSGKCNYSLTRDTKPILVSLFIGPLDNSISTNTWWRRNVAVKCTPPASWVIGRNVRKVTIMNGGGKWYRQTCDRGGEASLKLQPRYQR